MTTIADAVRLLEEIAPLALAEEWDNVGLLVGDPAARLGRAMTCLTLTPDVADEAIEQGVDLIVTHHPLPFRPVQRITTESILGDTLWRLIRAGVAVYSAHTAFDSAVQGINQQWGEGLGLKDPVPFSPSEEAEGGVGRVGEFQAADFQELIAGVKRVAKIDSVRVVAPSVRTPKRVAIACGSGGSLMEMAISAGADAFITGEMTFHDCLAARSQGIGVVLTGHFASERFAMETLARRLAESLPGVEIGASEAETDPLLLA